MLENDLYTLVRSTLLAGLTGAYAGVIVRPIYQPLTVGTSSTPQITMQNVLPGKRYGAPRRDVVQPGTGVGDMVNQTTQWWETTLQIGATARRDPTAADFLTLPSAVDICKKASDILQGDAGLTALAVQRVRPLRVTNIRNVQFVNESDQYEAMPSFDITLVYPQVIESTTPPVETFEPVTGRA
jgi:hypothetical protein